MSRSPFLWETFNKISSRIIHSSLNKGGGGEVWGGYKASCYKMVDAVNGKRTALEKNLFRKYFTHYNGTDTQGSQELTLNFSFCNHSHVADHGLLHVDSSISFRYQMIVRAEPKNRSLSFTEWPTLQSPAMTSF